MFKTMLSAVLIAWSLALSGCGTQTAETPSHVASAGRPDDGYDPYVNQRFSHALNTLFDRSSDTDTVWSVEVLAHGPRGERLSLYARDSVTSVKPASTMKIVTSWTAFQELSSASQIGSEKFNYMREMMKYSDNGMAENVLSWSGGVNAAYGMLAQFDIAKSAGLKIIDGSGLSYANRLSASDLVQILSVIRASDKAKAFRALLPVAGVDGTLADRMKTINGNVSAKTGTLTTDPTTALAGFGESKTGWQVVFAMLGDSVLSVEDGRRSIDDAMFEIINTLNYLPEARQSVSAVN